MQSLRQHQQNNNLILAHFDCYDIKLAVFATGVDKYINIFIVDQ